MARETYDPAKHHDPLIPLALIDRTRRTSGEEGKRQTRPRAVAWTSCPDCSNKRIGLAFSNGHLLYKEHYKVTFSGARMQCRASLSSVCVNPSRALIVNGHDEESLVWCKHPRPSEVEPGGA